MSKVTHAAISELSKDNAEPVSDALSGRVSFWVEEMKDDPKYTLFKTNDKKLAGFPKVDIFAVTQHLVRYAYRETQEDSKDALTGVYIRAKLPISNAVLFVPMLSYLDNVVARGDYHGCLYRQEGNSTVVHLSKYSDDADTLLQIVKEGFPFITLLLTTETSPAAPKKRGFSDAFNNPATRFKRAIDETEDVVNAS